MNKFLSNLPEKILKTIEIFLPVIWKKILSGHKPTQQTIQKHALAVVPLAHKRAPFEYIVKNPESSDKFYHKLLIAERKSRNDAYRYKIRLVNDRLHMQAVYMSSIALIGIVFCFYIVGFYHDSIPSQYTNTIHTMIGVFGACIKDAFAFEFGGYYSKRDLDLGNQ